MRDWRESNPHRVVNSHQLDLRATNPYVGLLGFEPRLKDLESSVLTITPQTKQLIQLIHKQLIIQDILQMQSYLYLYL